MSALFLVVLSAGCFGDDDDDEDDGGGGSLSGGILFETAYGDVAELDVSSGRVERLVVGAGAPRRGFDGELVYVDDCWAEDWDECYGESVRILEQGADEAEVAVPNTTIDTVALSPDGTLVALDEDCDGADWCEEWVGERYYYGVTVRDRASGELVHVFADGTESPVWLPDGRLLMVGYEPGVFYIASEDFESLDRIETELDYVSGPAVSPDGELLAFAGPDDIYTVGMDGSDLTVVVEEDPWSWVTFSPDGSRLAYADIFTIHVVPLGGGAPVEFEVRDGGDDEVDGVTGTPLSWW